MAEATHKAKILVVDDDPDMIRLLRHFLEREGYEVVEAQDGEEAVAQVAAQVPDLVLLDVMLPKMDGFQVAEWIKKDHRYRSIPVIMLTVREEVEDRVRGLDKGADDYVTKSSSHQELLARVRAMLRIKAMQDELQQTKQMLEEANWRLSFAYSGLRSNRDRLRDLLDCARSGVLILEPDGRIMGGNDTVSEWTGISRGSLLKLSLYDLCPDVCHDEMGSGLKQAGLGLSSISYIKLKGTVEKEIPVELNLSKVDLGERKTILAVLRESSKMQGTMENPKVSDTS